MSQIYKHQIIKQLLDGLRFRYRIEFQEESFKFSGERWYKALHHFSDETLDSAADVVFKSFDYPPSCNDVARLCEAIERGEYPDHRIPSPEEEAASAILDILQANGMEIKDRFELAKALLMASQALYVDSKRYSNPDNLDAQNLDDFGNFSEVLAVDVKKGVLDSLNGCGC